MDEKDKEIERLRTLAERAYPGLRPSDLCSRAHSEDRPDYKCTICFPDLNALLMEHVKVNGRLRDALANKDKPLGDIFDVVTPNGGRTSLDDCLVYRSDGVGFKCCGVLQVKPSMETAESLKLLSPTKAGQRVVFLIACHSDGTGLVRATHADAFKAPEVLLSGTDTISIAKIKTPSLRPRWMTMLGFSAFGRKWRIMPKEPVVPCLGDRCW